MYLHRRDAKAVAAAGGMYHVVPAGVFQPAALAPAHQANDFSLWRNVQREFSEEFLGNAEHDGNSIDPIAYDADEPFVSFERARQAGDFRVFACAIVLEPLSLWVEFLTVAVIAAPVFDNLFSADGRHQRGRRRGRHRRRAPHDRNSVHRGRPRTPRRRTALADHPRLHRTGLALPKRPPTLMRILVTGAAGFVGYAVAARLAEHGHDVTGLTRLPGAALPAGVAPHVGDIRDPDRCPTGRSTASATWPGWHRSASPAPSRCATGRPTPAACSPFSSGSRRSARTAWSSPRPAPCTANPNGSQSTRPPPRRRAAPTAPASSPPTAPPPTTPRPANLGAISLRAFNITGATPGRPDHDLTRLIPKLLAVQQGRAPRSPSTATAAPSATSSTSPTWPTPSPRSRRLPARHVARLQRRQRPTPQRPRSHPRRREHHRPARSPPTRPTRAGAPVPRR